MIDISPERQVDNLLARILQLERQLELSSRLDSVGMADYALWSAGAYVITSLTSPTYTLQSKTWTWFSLRPPLQLKPPELALSPELHLGYCWAMLGSNGTLGVALARTIMPRAITIDHVAKPLLLQVHSAPRDMEVWIVPEPEDRETALVPARWNDEELMTASGAELLGGPANLQHHRFRGTMFVRLANFTYNIHGTHPTQTFAVPNEVTGLRLRTDTALFKFLNNWGNEDYTCVYRIRVHGDSMED